ncbi:MAG: alpha/beta fold hydrolase [Roseiflexaceae bacterium]
MIPLLLAGTGAFLGAAHVLAPLREQIDPQDLAAGVGGRYARAHGYAIWYDDTGPRDRTPIVLLHGFAAWSFTWREVRQALLDAGQRVIRIDMIGCGASERVAAPAYSTHSHAEIVLSVLATLGVQQADLVGHSFGGRVAMQIALLAPTRVGKIVAICPEAFVSERPPIAALVGMPLFGFALSVYTTDPSLVRTGLGMVIRRDQWITPAVLEGYAAPLRVRGNALSQVWQARSPKDGPLAVPHHLSQIAAPTLLIWGEHDPIFPLEHGQRLTQLLPHAQLITIGGVGHLPYEEAADETIRPIVALFG